ncbi:MAG TPA: MauE/DoxX family redox-associated membrane protein [Actinomycetota bacterium]|nr:MauE/DoxX family redox-associated membrane protein [Actinomycetota bacterium]
MVETITPVVHGGSRPRWTAFLLVHVAGAAVAAAVFGAVLGGVGALLGAPWGGLGVVAIVGVAGLYLLREAFGVAVPVPQLRRQVPDWWRTFFPFAPASFLYGLGLGVGFFTYLSHGTLVVVAGAALVSGRPVLGAALVLPFGVARGLGAAAAFGARTPEESTALVGSLARAASWVGWRGAHATVLVAIALLAATTVTRPSRADVGAAAAAVLAGTFAVAAAAKLLRPVRWRRTLAAYRLPSEVERAAAGVPVIELSLAVLPFLGRVSSAGFASLVVLTAFSAAIVVARVRAGRLLDCGCFGRSAARDYRLLLARNAALMTVAAVAWRAGTDAGAVASVGRPSGDQILPAVLVLVGLALAIWAGRSAMRLARRSPER